MFLVGRSGASPLAARRLLSAYLMWAEANPSVSEIMLSHTDALPEGHRIGRVYDRLGFEQCGSIFRKTVSLASVGEIASSTKTTLLNSGSSRRLVGASTPDSKATTLLMHRQITGEKPVEEVDHVDGNPLNNSRSSLRLCIRSENMYNSGGWSSSEAPA